jgi:hypothetical protein
MGCPQRMKELDQTLRVPIFSLMEIAFKEERIFGKAEKQGISPFERLGECGSKPLDVFLEKGMS